MARTSLTGVFDRAYVINLANATERWRTVSQEFARIGIAPTRVDGVRGKALSEEETARIATPSCTSFCTPAMIGAAASHIKVWRQVLADGVAHAMVCEDDVEFADDFCATLQAYAREVPPDYDLVYVGCFGCQADDSLLTKFAMSVLGARHPSREVSEHVWVPPTAVTLHCYLVSAKGARKLLAAIDGRVSGHVDRMMNDLKGDGTLTVYALRPLLATQDVSLAATSISVAQAPRLPNLLLDDLAFAQEPHVTWGYAACAPFGRVGRFTVNLWTPAFLVGGLGLGLLSTPAAVALALCLLLLVLDLWYILKGDVDTLVSAAVFLLLGAVGWGVGRGIIALACRGGGSGGGSGAVTA